MMIKTRRTGSGDYRGILSVAEAMSKWFDADQRRRAIPVDIRYQEGYVALDNKRIVGFMTVFVTEGRLHIGWLAVRPEFQGRGIGRVLLRCAERSACRKGLREVSAYTLGAGSKARPYAATRDFYFKNGFKTYRVSKTDCARCPEEIEIKKRLRRSS